MKIIVYIELSDLIKAIKMKDANVPVSFIPNPDGVAVEVEPNQILMDKRFLAPKGRGAGLDGNIFIATPQFTFLS